MRMQATFSLVFRVRIRLKSPICTPTSMPSNKGFRGSKISSTYSIYETVVMSNPWVMKRHPFSKVNKVNTPIFRYKSQ